MIPAVLRLIDELDLDLGTQPPLPENTSGRLRSDLQRLRVWAQAHAALSNPMLQAQWIADVRTTILRHLDLLQRLTAGLSGSSGPPMLSRYRAAVAELRSRHPAVPQAWQPSRRNMLRNRIGTPP